MKQTLRQISRLGLVGIVIAGFLGEALFREPGMSLAGWEEPRKRKARSRSMGRWARWLMGVLNFDVRFRPACGLDNEGALLVANHLSFWDVIAIATHVPVVFVTSVEMRDTPVLGWICRAAGCVFVDRRDRSRKNQEREEVALALREGSAVVLFPEATSTDGSGVLPFKKSFFSPAIESGRPVIPMCINYGNIDGRPVDRSNRDLVFYYGDQKFHTQLLRTLRLRSLEISIEMLDPIPTHRESTDREWLVKQAYEAVTSRFVPVGG